MPDIDVDNLPDDVDALRALIVDQLKLNDKQAKQTPTLNDVVASCSGVTPCLFSKSGLAFASNNISTMDLSSEYSNTAHHSGVFPF